MDPDAQPSRIFQQQQLAPDREAGGGDEAVIDLCHTRIRYELAGDGKFVLGQGGNEPFACLDRLGSREQDRDDVPRPGEGDARPWCFSVRDNLTVVIAHHQQRVAKAVGRQFSGTALRFRARRKLFTGLGRTPDRRDSLP